MSATISLCGQPSTISAPSPCVFISISVKNTYIHSRRDCVHLKYNNASPSKHKKMRICLGKQMHSRNISATTRSATIETLETIANAGVLSIASKGGGGLREPYASIIKFILKGGPFGLVVRGCKLRAQVDPAFPSKLLMEEIAGATAGLLGDMSARRNFGLEELDFVFSTLIVGSLMNFVLIYMLAPTAATSALSHRLPGIFAGCPSSHMFEAGSFSLLQRVGTFVFKGIVFGLIGFSGGLRGTGLARLLIGLRKKIDPSFETSNKPLPPMLNAATWSLQMGFSSNLRYQMLSGLEILIKRKTTPPINIIAIFALRCLNSFIGGMTFVLFTRLTGSQKVGKEEQVVSEEK